MIKSEPRDPLIGQLVGGRYEVLRVIGKGGTGSIYEVRNVRLGRSFALKTLTAEAAASVEAMQRFRREAEIVARIKHPNIVEIVDWDELPDGSPCIVMEYLRGEDLASRIKTSAPLPWPMIAQIADQTLAALSVTHASGVVHRDLKPQNIFLSLDDAGDERVKLLDFGVSKIRDHAGTVPDIVTTDSRLVGTPAYMAPEQAEGRTTDVGTHTDLWAMAIMLHEMATGVRAFSGPSMPAVLYAICHGEPEPILAYRADAPTELVELIADAMVRPVGARLADAAAMRARIRDALRIVGAVHYSRAIRATPATGLEQSDEAPPVARSRDALADTTPVGVSLTHTLPQALPQTPPPRPRKRTGLRVAIIGAALLGSAALAFVLVKSARKETDAPQVAAVPVVESDAAMATVEIDDAAVTTAVVDAVADASVRKPDKPDKPDKPVPRDTPSPERLFIQNATRAINARAAQLVECFNKNADASAQIKATILIGANGRAKTVSFTPAAIDGSALGACLRTELTRVEYPAGERDQTFSIPLRATAR